MAWEWVAPVCTGAAGVAGIAATAWTGRAGRLSAAREAEAQRDHARSIRLDDDRRSAYLGFLEAVAAGRWAVLRAREAMRQEPVGYAEALEVSSQALTGLSRAWSHLQLVAPEPTRDAASPVYDLVVMMLRDAPLPDQTELTIADRLPMLERTLLARMKQDLDLELTAVDEDALERASSR